MQGASQIRQSFSKRKRGIAQKAYQLHKITDAKVGLPLLHNGRIYNACASAEAKESDYHVFCLPSSSIFLSYLMLGLSRAVSCRFSCS